MVCAFADLLARVIVHYGRNADEAKTVVNQIRANGGQADAVAADLAAPDGAHVLAAEVAQPRRRQTRHSRVERRHLQHHHDRDHVGEGLRQPVRCQCARAVFLVQQLLPIMGEGGTIVFVSSLGARAAVGTLAAYASTKGAINTLVKYLASALGQRGIRVTRSRPA